MKNHGPTNYHQLCIEKVSSFINNFNAGGSKSLNIILSDKTKSVMEANRKRLVSIVKTIIFCGKNNLALRGHRDDGTFDP